MSFSIGSVTESIYSLIDELPTGLSGTNLNVFANQARILVSNFTQQTLDFPIDEKYFGPTVKIGASLTLMRKAGIGTDATSITLGELTVDKGSESPDAKLAQHFWDVGKFELTQLGRKVAFGRSFG